MGFVSWHFTRGINYYLEQYAVALAYIVHYFSLNLLLPTLFAPWKRLISHEQSRGFNLVEQLQVLSFNFISRFIGAIVRIILFVSGVLILGIIGVSGLFVLVVWIFIPVFSYAIYMRFKSNPEEVARVAIEKEEYLDNEAGRFILQHVGFGKSVVKHIFNDKKVTVSATVNGMGDLFEELVKEDKFNEDFFREHEFTTSDFVSAARWWDEYTLDRTDISPKTNFGKPGIGLQLLFGYTPELNKHSIDMGEKQNFTHHLIGRQETVGRIERAMQTGAGVILKGEPGVGKRTVVFEFARRASLGELGKEMSYRRVLEFDYNFIFSESTDISQKKIKLLTILEEAAGAGNIVLVIRDLHRIINSGVEGIDFTDVFEQMLEKRKLKIIAVSTNEDFEKYLATNAKIRKYFEAIEVPEVNMEDAMRITTDAAKNWESIKNLVITTPAIRKLVESSDRYITDTPFPEKSLELLDAVIAYHERQGHDRIVDVSDLDAVLSEKTGVSFAKMTESDRDKLVNIEDVIHTRLVNQSAAVSSIARVLRSKSTGVINNKRPLGSFLFLGPTGVGKTETAKVLSRVYFGSEARILRFNMAEYASNEGVERLLGSVSNNIPGELTTAIHTHPSSLLLLDEIEKAPSKVLNLLLALLDEGVISDVRGKKVIASSLFVVATSNAGDEFLRQVLSKDGNHEDLQKQVIDHVLKSGIFSPELINRFDGVVVYEPLSREHLKKIAILMLEDLTQNILSKNIRVSFDETAINALVEKGYDPAFGARPMRRVIEIDVADKISTAILKGEVKPGDKIMVHTDTAQNFEIKTS